jgi:hypothetical protein
MEECPICTEPLNGTLATMGCCQKMMHVECLVRCMKEKLSCPMCRAEHDGLRVVQNQTTQIMVVQPPPPNTKFFRDFFLMTLATSIVIVSCGGYY